MVKLFYTNNISIDLAHHEIHCAKVGKGGIKNVTVLFRMVNYIRVETHNFNIFSQKFDSSCENFLQCLSFYNSNMHLVSFFRMVKTYMGNNP